MGNGSRYGRKRGSTADTCFSNSFVSASSRIMVRRKKFPSVWSSSHFVSRRPRHSSKRERTLMLRTTTTPRIEVDQRSREARLRLERAERLIVVVMTRRSLLVARTSGLVAKLRRVLSRSGLVLTALTDLAQWPQMTSSSRSETWTRKSGSTPISWALKAAWWI